MKTFLYAAGIASIALSGCQSTGSKEAQPTIVGVVDESNLNDLLLTTANPNEAVSYFQTALQKDPTRNDLRLGLAKSLLRAKRPNEAIVVFSELDQLGALSSAERVNFAEAYVRAGEWENAAQQLNKVPPSIETFQRYRLEALVADSQKKWAKADSFYKTATGLTTQPASIYNNWGYSKLNRGDAKGAETLFIKAISFDKSLFTAKNNLVIARAKRKEYNMPIVPMSQLEQAELTYTAALGAIDNKDITSARNLLKRAIELHPRHFEKAIQTLNSLNQ